ncbi:ASKHA domain-containing protein [Fibrobacterota bacterium]
MPSCKVTFLPQKKTVQVDKGATLLEAASRAGILVNSLCGGEGTCGGCRMKVKKGKTAGGISERLTREEAGGGMVLSCLAEAESDLTVEIPRKSLVRKKTAVDSDLRRFAQLDTKLRELEFIPSPLVKKIYLELEEPTLASNMADHQRVCAAIRKKLGVSTITTPLSIIKCLPGGLRKHKFRVTATVGVNGDSMRLMNMEGGNTEMDNYLIVVDMGTTTLVAHLIDAVSHKTAGAAACFNSQMTYGREVTARMIAAEKKGDDKLHEALVRDINRLIKGLLKQSGVKIRDVNAVVCAGNTPMTHFLLDLPTRNIRRTPYVSSSVEPPVLRAGEVGLRINPTGLLYCLPGISGWVGSDLTAGILATGMYNSEKMSLLVDIGTNGEIIVGNREWMMSCSASAGPALEGASVECGMRAEEGAIEKVSVKRGRLCFETIGNVPPRGICGSGIIDLISVMLERKIINRSGKIVDGPPDRIKKKDGIRQYVLLKRNEKRNKSMIFISEADIENIITAKAAIFAAMKIMLHRLDMQFSDIDVFFLAGAFGKHININNAINIGLIPNIPRERVKFAGNTSLMGAKIAALHREGFKKTREIEENTTYYDLMGADDYVEEFQKAMFLPHTDIEYFSGAEA